MLNFRTPFAEATALFFYLSDFINQLVDMLHDLDLLNSARVSVGLLDQSQLGLRLLQLRLKSEQFLAVVVHHISRQLVDPIDLIELVVDQQFPQNLILLFRSIDLLSQFQPIPVILEKLQSLELRLWCIIVQRTQFLAFSPLTFPFLFHLVFLSPLALGFSQTCQLLLGTCLISVLRCQYQGLGRMFHKDRNFWILKVGTAPQLIQCLIRGMFSIICL
jgi:hypothetical protein